MCARARARAEQQSEQSGRSVYMWAVWTEPQADELAHLS